jgi:hypothetical protein
MNDKSNRAPAMGVSPAFSCFLSYPGIATGSLARKIPSQIISEDGFAITLSRQKESEL